MLTNEQNKTVISHLFKAYKNRSVKTTHCSVIGDLDHFLPIFQLPGVIVMSLLGNQQKLQLQLNFVFF